MARQESDHDSKPESTTPETGPSRRSLLATGLTAAGAGLALAASAEGAPDHDDGNVGVASKGSTAVEFRARFEQTGDVGQSFLGYGYLTRAAGTTDGQLFSGSTHGDATALLTAYAVGHLVRRTVDQAVHELDVEGTLTIYRRSGPGASFADPDSFRQGTPVAVFDITLQDIVTVFAPAQGLPTLNGDLTQTASARIMNGGRFGHVGAQARLYATGLGRLTDPARLNSMLEMAGHWTTK